MIDSPTPIVLVRRAILIVSGVLFVLQFLVEYAFFQHGGVRLIAIVCSNDAFGAIPLYCSLPWWCGVLGTSIHCWAQIFSMIRYTSLKWYWWCGVLPAIAIAGAALVGMSIPLLNVEISR